MGQRNGRKMAITAVVLGVVTIVVAGITLKDWALDQWYIRSGEVPLDRFKWIANDDDCEILEIEGIMVIAEWTTRHPPDITPSGELNPQMEPYLKITKVIRTGKEENPYVVFRGNTRLVTHHLPWKGYRSVEDALQQIQGASQ